VCRGLTNAAIALALGRSERVVELHISRLFTKARVSNRASLVSAFWAGAA
jgi:DNA-binding NarL/FixJ family response regulator